MLDERPHTLLAATLERPLGLREQGLSALAVKPLAEKEQQAHAHQERADVQLRGASGRQVGGLLLCRRGTSGVCVKRGQLGAKDAVVELKHPVGVALLGGEQGLKARRVQRARFALETVRGRTGLRSVQVREGDTPARPRPPSRRARPGPGRRTRLPVAMMASPCQLIEPSAWPSARTRSGPHAWARRWRSASRRAVSATSTMAATTPAPTSTVSH